MTDNRPSEDLPPGTPDIHMMSAGAFRRHYEEQRKTYLTAATTRLYPSVAFPYHYDVLTTSRQFLSADMDDVAVIMAQTACEIALQDLIDTLLRRLAMPGPMQSWVEDVIDGSSTLRNPRLYELYKALSGDHFKGGPLWQPYDRHVGLRNDIVHRGGHASKAQAIEACETAQKVIQHFETIL